MKSFSTSAAVLAGGLMFAGAASGATFSEDFEGGGANWSNATDGAAATFGTYGTGTDFSGSSHATVLGGAGGAFYGNTIIGTGASANAEAEGLHGTVTAIDAGHTVVNVSAWLASWTGGNERTLISIELFSDAAGTASLGTTLVLDGTATNGDGGWNGNNWSFYSGSVATGGAASYSVVYGNSGGNDNYVDNISAASGVPEPGSLALLGLGGLALLRRRR